MTTRDWFTLVGVSLALANGSSALGQQDLREQVREQDSQAQAPAICQASDGQGCLPDTPPPENTNPRVADGRYQLRKGDVLELNFPFVPDFNQTITVQPDGYVTLRVVGAFRVDGMTLPELTRTLRAEYNSILLDPVITVELKDFEKPYFIVAGEVERPGKYDLRGQTTVTQAVAVAGGLKERAKHSRAVVFRRSPTGDFEAKELDLKKMLKEAHLDRDLRLQPGDMLFIPKGRGVRLSDLTSLTSSLWVLNFLY